MPENKQPQPAQKEQSKTAQPVANDNLNKVKAKSDPKNKVKNTNENSKKVKRPKNKKKRNPFFSAIVVAIMNVLGLFAVIFVMTILNTKSVELKNLRNAAIGAEKRGGANVGDLQIESNITKYDDLTSLFPDEEGVVEFVKQIEKLKAEGVVVDFSFVNQDVVTDRTKSVGFPFVLEFKGNWESIDRDLQKIQNLPFIIRAVTVTVESAKDDSGDVVLKYGGFLYVSETFN